MAEEVEGERSRGRVSSAASASEGFLPLNDPPVIHFSRRSLARFYEAKYGKIALCARCVLLCSFAQSFFPLFLRSLVLTEATANIENSIRYIFPNCCLCVKRKDCLSVFLPFDLHHSLFGLSCIFVKFVSSDINPIGTFSSIRATCEVSAYGREKNSSQRVKDTIYRLVFPTCILLLKESAMFVKNFLKYWKVATWPLFSNETMLLDSLLLFETFIQRLVSIVLD